MATKCCATAIRTFPTRKFCIGPCRSKDIVVTMDKDFGDLIWKERLPHAGVILLRMEDATGPERASAMRRIVREFGAELPQRFTVFKNDRLRISR